MVNKNCPIGQTNFVVTCAQDIVCTIGIPNAVAVDVTELCAADFADDDCRRSQLNRSGSAAIDVYCGLQRSTGPCIRTIGQSLALIGHIAGCCDHQTVLDFSTPGCRCCTGVGEGDRHLAITGAAIGSCVGHAAHRSNVGVDGIERSLHAATIGKCAVGECGGPCKTCGRSVFVRRCHIDKSPGIGVALVIVVGHIKRVALTCNQWRIVAGFVKVSMRNHFALKVVRLAIGQDVVVPFRKSPLSQIAICPMLIDLADVGAGVGDCIGRDRRFCAEVCVFCWYELCRIFKGLGISKRCKGMTGCIF